MKKTGRGRFLYDQMGPGLVYSERTNEELEDLFRKIISDHDFLNLCQDELIKNRCPSFDVSNNSCAYDEVPLPEESDQAEGQVVHEINMSVYYDFQVDQKNSNLKFLQSYIEIIPEENETSTGKNRFSDLNLSNDIDRLVQMHDHVHHHPRHATKNTQNKPSESSDAKKTSVKRRSTPLESKRRSTISSVPDASDEFDSASLARIVEDQLDAARRAGSLEHFNPIEGPSLRTHQSAQRVNFVQAPTLATKANENEANRQSTNGTLRRHRIDHIEFPRANLDRFSRRPLTFIEQSAPSPLPEHDQRKTLVSLTRQGIVSSAVALGSRTIPDHIKSIDLLEMPQNRRAGVEQQDFHLISYETLDAHSRSTAPGQRRSKSARRTNQKHDGATKRASTLLTDDTSRNVKLRTPLKSIKRHLQSRNETAIQNRPVQREKCLGRRS